MTRTPFFLSLWFFSLSLSWPAGSGDEEGCEEGCEEEGSEGDADRDVFARNSGKCNAKSIANTVPPLCAAMATRVIPKWCRRATKASRQRGRRCVGLSGVVFPNPGRSGWIMRM